jgi:vancomycin permeability regulator SanA
MADGGNGTAATDHGKGRRRRRLWLSVAAVTLTAIATPIAPTIMVHIAVRDRLHSEPSAVRPAPVAIVLGAGLDGAGRPSPFLAERIAVAAQLYRLGRVRALLMSGDHSRTGYDEVGAMAAAAEHLGVPASAIVQDHAGFDTYSSCYRARSVWGISRAVVVTQPFHLARAVWLCNQLGVDAEGAPTPEDAVSATDWGKLREVATTTKSVLDVWRDRTPMFPGPREHTLDGVNAAG